MPLMSLLGKKYLEMLPPRIQSMRINMRYQFRLLYVLGKLLPTADTLSRASYDQVQLQDVDSVMFASDALKALPTNVASQIEAIRQHQN